MSDATEQDDVVISDVHWWDLAEIADNDSRVFGATAWTVQYYWAVMAQPGTVMLMARTASAGQRSSDSAGELAGWIVMSVGGDEGDVMTIATTAAARGHGIGRSLLTSGIGWARQQGAHVVHLEVDEHNEPALDLYHSIGFSEWGRRPDYYPGADAILMQLRP
ncbi:MULTISPECIES: GNAT family N-acetyltransferase [Brevibacterium]|uniref:Ribosomal-protein-alanine N-acetyltransferase n=1 Tax=Brevibacterium antiquum CNRZ 918 TaxID=1255637 RepID=A0A2H1KSV9_9MICO|nr:MULTISPECIES: GNAT family N-acetyltransferase [Brevibacterium]SMY02893.1 ribosomal-protein-alanine N-acetyltransferase [Brevibacterium antiquum CNRZ 918]HCG54952.1 GNAT family N-acetyltransferase [Brevibacterium sp.]